MTDPGAYSTMQSEARDVDAVLITHEHQDHLHVESLKEVLQNNSNAKVVTNPSVGKILSDQGIEYHSVADGESIDIKGIMIEGMGTTHAEIYKELGQVENTGYFFSAPGIKNLFYPGDAFYEPGKEVDILALPVAGPWCNVHDAIEYALAVRPRVAFPVHDANLLFGFGMAHKAPSQFLPENGIEFVVVSVGETKEF